jgi:hypothetical protein
MTDANATGGNESEASRLFHASQRPVDLYIATDQNARIERERIEQGASSRRKSIVLCAVVLLCLATGFSSIHMFLSRDDEKSRDQAVAFGSASISFLVGLIGGSQL